MWQTGYFNWQIQNVHISGQRAEPLTQTSMRKIELANNLDFMELVLLIWTNA